MTEVWDKPNPKKDHKKLSDSKKASAKARAKAAGRPYPNMVDNMHAAKNESTLETIKRVIAEDWQKAKYKNEKGGLTQAGVNKYKSENPGSKLKTAVTKDPKDIKTGSCDDKRRKSFCSRMKGMKSKLTGSEAKNDPDSRINKSLKQWNC